MSKQQGQAPDDKQETKPLANHKKKVKKPFELWHIWDKQRSWLWKSGDYRYGRYKTREQAEIVKAKMEREYAGFRNPNYNDYWEIREKK